MPVFDYKGFDKTGKSISGSREADSEKTVRVVLRREGILATQVTETGIKAVDKKNVFSRQIKFKQMLQSVSAEEIGLMTRQLATLLQAGVPLVDSLRALVDQVDKPNFKEVLSAVKDDVNEGLSLADAMAKHKIFTNIYVNMVRAGESSGTMEVVLERLADFLDSQSALKSKVKGAMTYPMVMLGVAALVMIVMLTTVVPRITSIFEQAKVQLPFMTRALIASSDAAQRFWWLVILIIGTIIYFARRYKNTEAGRARWDEFKLKLPVVGDIVQKVVVARFTRTLATLLSGGVPLLTTLQICRNVVDNDVYEKAIDSIRDSVREGEDIATPLKRSGRFPSMVTHMIAIGEKSGQLEAMLARIANSYEQQVDAKLSILTSLLSPFMILFMAAMIGGIAGAIIMPIMQMSQLVQ